LSAQGRADNVFLLPKPIQGAVNPTAVRIGDVTGDGRDDLVLSGRGDVGLDTYGRIDVFAQTAAGTLDGPHTYSGIDDATTVQDSGLALGDVTGDGRLDVIVATGTGIGVFAQKSDGTLGTVVRHAQGPWGVIAVDDFDDDGLRDVLVTSKSATSTALTFFPQVSGGTLGPPVGIPVGCPGMTTIGVGDINGDRRADVVVGDHTSICWALQNPGGGFATPVTHAVTATGTYPFVESIAIGDVDGDGHADIVAGIDDGSRLYTLYQHASGVFDAPSIIPLGGYPSAIVSRDVTADGIADVLVYENQSVVVHRGTNGPLPALVASPAVSISPSPYADVLAVGDLNGDGLLDAATTHVILYGTAANLKIAVHHDPEPVLAGAELTYTVTVSNAGPDSTDDVVLTFTDGGIGSLFNADNCGSPCTLGTLAEGASKTVTFTVRPDAPGTYRPHFSVTGYAYDPQPADNETDDTTTVLPSADVAVSLSGGAAGSVVGWFASVSNHGPVDAENVHVDISVPDGTPIQTAGIVGGGQGSCTVQGQTVSCALGTLPKTLGADVTIQIDSRAQGAGSFTGSADVTSSTPDPDATSNHAEHTISTATTGTTTGVPGFGAGDSGACGCRTACSNEPPSALWLVVLLALGRRRYFTPLRRRPRRRRNAR
jgi:hypothetical protein